MAFRKQMLENADASLALPLPNMYAGPTAGAALRKCERCGAAGVKGFQLDQKRWLVFCSPCFDAYSKEFRKTQE